MKYYKYTIPYSAFKIASFLSQMTRGWGNGYVAVPKEHSFYGKEYSECREGEILVEELINIHGSLTFSQSADNLSYAKTKLKAYIPEELIGNKNYWVFGFDTAHLEDNENNCNEDFVIKETDKLLKELKKYEQYNQNPFLLRK